MNKLLKKIGLIVKLYNPINELTSGNIQMLHNMI